MVQRASKSVGQLSWRQLTEFVRLIGENREIHIQSQSHGPTLSWKFAPFFHEILDPNDCECEPFHSVIHRPASLSCKMLSLPDKTTHSPHRVGITMSAPLTPRSSSNGSIAFFRAALLPADTAVNPHEVAMSVGRHVKRPTSLHVYAVWLVSPVVFLWKSCGGHALPPVLPTTSTESFGNGMPRRRSEPRPATNGLRHRRRHLRECIGWIVGLSHLQARGCQSCVSAVAGGLASIQSASQSARDGSYRHQPPRPRPTHSLTHSHSTDRLGLSKRIIQKLAGADASLSMLATSGSSVIVDLQGATPPKWLVGPFRDLLHPEHDHPTPTSDRSLQYL